MIYRFRKKSKRKRNCEGCYEAEKARDHLFKEGMFMKSLVACVCLKCYRVFKAEEEQ